MPAESESVPTSSSADEIVTVSVRRSPKYGVFLILGAALGLVVAMILTFAYHGTDAVSPNTGVSYTVMQVFGFVALICVTVGIVIGGVVALVLDRVVGRRTRDIRVDHETVHTAD